MGTKNPPPLSEIRGMQNFSNHHIHTWALLIPNEIHQVTSEFL
jgi:hypothetical protein